MVNLAGLLTGSDPGLEAMQASVTKQVLDEEGLSVHAGLLETSRLMAVRPDLVSPMVAQAPSVTARDIPELYRIAPRPDWPGYFGAPRHSTPEIGRRVFDGDNELMISLAVRLLDRQIDERDFDRVSSLLQNADVANALQVSMQRDRSIAQRQRDWLAAHRP